MSINNSIHWVQECFSQHSSVVRRAGAIKAGQGWVFSLVKWVQGRA